MSTVLGGNIADIHPGLSIRLVVNDQDAIPSPQTLKLPPLGRLNKLDIIQNRDLFIGQLYDVLGFWECPDNEVGHKTDLAVRLAGLYKEISTDKPARKELLSCQGGEAQVVLDTLLWAIDSTTAAEEKTILLKLLLRLSRKSSSYPSCLSLVGVTRDQYPVTSGHFGEIWKGQYMEQKVCLKVIKVYQRSQIDHFLKVFCREAALWSQLKHMNVLPFYGIYKLQDSHERICLVSPWMEHGTLREYLSNNSSEAEHCVLAIDVAKGLSYLHDMGIVHGDLKGDNVLVDQHGHACLADFGLASHIDGEMLRWTTLESTGIMGGTARWQAPELLDPEDESSRPTRQSDIYALGCVFYEIFTGNLPFHEVARDATVIAHVQQGRRPSSPNHSCALTSSHLSMQKEEIWRTIRQCWSEHVATRPTLQEIVALHAFSSALDVWGARYSAMRSRQEGDNLSASTFRYAMRFQVPGPTKALREGGEQPRHHFAIANVQQGRRPSSPNHSCALTSSHLSMQKEEIWRTIRQCWSEHVATRPTLQEIVALHAFSSALDVWGARYSAMRSRQEGDNLSASTFRYAMRFQVPGPTKALREGGEQPRHHFAIASENGPELWWIQAPDTRGIPRPRVGGFWENHIIPWLSQIPGLPNMADQGECSPHRLSADVSNQIWVEVTLESGSSWPNGIRYRFDIDGCAMICHPTW